MMLGVENADGAALTAGDKDYTPIATTAEGYVIVSGSTDAAAGPLNVDGTVVIGSGTVTAVTDITNTVTVDGTVTANPASGTIDTVTNITSLDKAVYVDDADWTDSTSSHLLVGGLYQSSPQTITDGDVGPLQVSATGALLVSGGGGGTEYTEDVATANPIIGTATMMERDDQLAGVTPAQGDWLSLRGTDQGALWVAIADGSGDPITSFGGGTEYTQDVAHADPATASTFLMARDDALSTQETTDGDWTLPRANARGAQWVEIDGTNALSVTESSPISGFATSALQLADGHNVTIDNASSDEVFVRGSQSAGSPVDGEVVTVQGIASATPVIVTGDSGGSLTVDGTVTANAGTGTQAVSLASATVASGAIASGAYASGALASGSVASGAIASGAIAAGAIADMTFTNGGVYITGDEAHDAADAGNPVKVGGRAQDPNAQPEEVADNDRVDALFDENGYQRVRGDFNPLFADINDTTSGNNTIQASAGAGKKIAVWSVLVVADGTVDVRFEDGAGGTAFTGQIPLLVNTGFSYSAGGLVPLWVGSAATLLNMELSATIVVHGHVSYTVMDD